MTTSDNEVIGEAVAGLPRAGTDSTTVEVKTAVGELPRSVAETLSTFGNEDGGVIILGS